MGRKSKKRNFNRFNPTPGPSPDLRFITTVKVPQPDIQRLVPRAVRGFQHNPKVPVAQNNVKWSGKKMGHTKFSMFTKKTGLNTIMSNKDGKGGFKIPALMLILAVVLGGGGYWAYSSLSSTEWGRMSTSQESTKWLEKVSSQRDNGSSGSSTKAYKNSEAFKTWGSAPTKSTSHKASLKKSASKKHIVGKGSKKAKGKKFVAGKKSSYKKAAYSSKHKKKAKVAKLNKKKSKSKNIHTTSSRR